METKQTNTPAQKQKGVHDAIRTTEAFAWTTEKVWMCDFYMYFEYSCVRNGLLLQKRSSLSNIGRGGDDNDSWGVSQTQHHPSVPY